VDVADTAVSPADVDWLAKVPSLTVTRIRPPYAALERQLMFNLDRPQVRNIKVRQAISHAIDLNAIVNIVQFGQARVSPSPITVAAYNDPRIQPYKVDLNLANSLLDQAHLPRRWGGMRFALKLRYNATADARTAEYIRSALSKLGIRIDIVRTDLPIYLKAVYTDRDFDITLESLSNTFDPSLGVQRIYWSKNFKLGVPYSNGPHYVNPRVDQLLEDAAKQPDQNRRKADFNAFQKIVYDDIPIIDLYAPEGIIVANKRVRDEINPAGGTEYNFANTWLTKK
jgi:peptide/nickel transport system substrate-binding protein